MSSFDEQLRYKKVVLEEITQRQPVRWKDIMKNTVKVTGSSTRSQFALDWLLRKGYIRRTGRGIYETTAKGTKFLVGLKNTCSPELTGHEELRKE